MTDPSALAGSLASGAVTVIAVGMTGLWLAAAWWAYLDISRRTESELVQLAAVGWILLSTPLLLPLALGTYVLLRPQSTAAQRRSERLMAVMGAEVEVAACPGCGEARDHAWRRCPACTTWLQAACRTCGRWSGVELQVCPWCAEDRVGPSPVTARAAAVAVPVHEEARRRVAPARLVRR
jgi:hypothetical protein